MDAAIAFHRELGPGLLETLYDVILARELQELGLEVGGHYPKGWHHATRSTALRKPIRSLRSWRLGESSFHFPFVPFSIFSDMGFFKSFRITLEMIKFEHTVFALPFALLSAILASEGWPGKSKLFWIILAMVGARSAAMAFNRLADWQIDAQNPRTQSRALPAGQLSRSFALLFTVGSSLLFISATYRLNPLCFRLSLPVLLILLFYSYTKRFTHYSHFILGFCLGMAPLGAWIAVRGDVRMTPILLCIIVMLWTAGFDIIYACQDVEFDRRKDLFSIPKRFGIKAALNISSALHLLMLFLLMSLFYLESLGWISLAGIALVACLLWYEHSLVRPNDLSKVNAAFFTVNGYISILLLLAVGLDKLVLGR